jgi:glycosyltransferase involved in cell wall biosynthesis
LRENFFVAVVLDLSNTAHCRSATGVQRVARQLYAALAEIGAEPVAVVYDPYAKRWRGLDADERALLAPAAAEKPSQNRREVWSLAQKARGYLRRGVEPDWAKLRGAPLFAPEIFSARIGAAHAALRERLGGPAAAVFHDAVALRLPEFTPAGNVARVADYLRALAGFNAILAFSRASHDELLEYWARHGPTSHPPVTVIPHPIDPPAIPPAPSTTTNDPRGPLVLSVGTMEGRKNHGALLDAAEILWREGLRFRLVLAGLPRPETAAAALRHAAQLRAAGRALELPGAVPESQLQALYGECRFTVYPSLYEGYGLPVAESLLRQRPCLCGMGGALKEVAAGGGCVVVPEPTAPQLAQAMRKLLEDDAELARLTGEAAARRFPTYGEFARQLAAWLQTLSRRARD